MPNRFGKESVRALQSRSRSFFQRFWEFLKNILLLFRQNPKELALFLLFCAVFTLLGTALLKNVLIALMMKVSGTSYITPDNLKAVVLHPASLLLLFFFALIVTLFSLFEIAGLLHAFSMAQVGRDTNLNSMFMAGLRTCRETLKPQNWPLMLFIMVLLPLTKVLPLSSSTAKLILPGFVNQTINYTRSLRVAYGVFYVALCIFIVVYIFSINIFVLQKTGFLHSCDRSRRLGAGRYMETALMMLLLTVLLNFIINSVASILVINARELVGFFQRGSAGGVVSKSAEMG